LIRHTIERFCARKNKEIFPTDIRRVCIDSLYTNT
jgi:hypothetical protein